MIDQQAFLDAVRPLLDELVTSQREQVSAAAQLLAECIRDGGVVQAFGTGHSNVLAMELTGRAGGLLPVNRMAIKDLVMRGGWDPGRIMDPAVERDETLAHSIWELHDVDPRDVFVIASNSGRNGAVVELALLARRCGHRLVAVTSRRHAARVSSRHPSGKLLLDLADVVIDNCAPFGDALLELPGGQRTGAVSSLAAALVAQLLTTETIGLLLGEGDDAPVFRSANMPGGDDHNERMLARYGARIHLSEP